MKEKRKILHEYFAKLNLSKDVADLYLCLVVQGPQNISQLARNAGIERTRVYRLLEDLRTNALVEVETHYKSQRLKAVPIENLEILFAKKEQELLELQRQLPIIKQVLSEDVIQASGTRIQFYYGLDGVKQMLWNETRANTDVLSILHDNMQVNTAEKFFERWVRRCNERNLACRSVVNDKFLASQAAWYDAHTNEKLQNWQARYIPKEVFNLSHSTNIYDDIVAYYDWQDNEIFGIEICNATIADEQRRFFELLWEQADKLPGTVNA